MKASEGQNGHVYQQYTKHRGPGTLPTMRFVKCVKCDMYACSSSRTPFASFSDKARRGSCLEWAYREFRLHNKIRGAKQIEQVCEDEGIVEDHQFAEGIEVPTSPLLDW